MSDAIIVALISGGISLLGILLSHKATVDKVQHNMEIQQAILQTKMDGMQKDIEEHNHYAKLFNENIPVIREQIKVANHRIDDLERKVG